MSAKKDPVADLKENIPSNPTTSSISEQLRGRLKFGRDSERTVAKNPSLPEDFFEIQNWPADLDYKWIPATGGDAPAINSSPQMMAIRTSAFQKGWNWYPSELFGLDGTDDRPWIHSAEEDNGKVRLFDNWLIYNTLEGVEERRAAAVARVKSRRENYINDLDDNSDGRITTAHESERGTVGDILKKTR